jgi:hypothetical protein|tara:strand:- start:231 stop:389 length:159 start_codon:yes stop_codon:yes gene_type:complete
MGKPYESTGKAITSLWGYGKRMGFEEATKNSSSRTIGLMNYQVKKLRGKMRV